MRADTHEWLARAEADLVFLRSARSSTYPELATGILLFVCHHAAELSLKALLTESRIVPQKTHDLIQLMDDAGSAGWLLKIDREDAESLSRFAIRSRYPGVRYTEQDLAAAFLTAEAIVSEVRSILSNPGVAQE